MSRSIDLLLAGQAGGEIERRLAGVDAELLGVADGAQHLGGLQQLLRGDAPPVQAGPADARLLDHGDVQAGRRAVERGRVATRAAAEDDDVVVIGHGHLRVRRSDRRPFSRIVVDRPTRSDRPVHRARKIWTTPAATIARPVTSARISSVRVFTWPSSRAGPARTRGGRPTARDGAVTARGTVPRGHGYTRAAFGWSVHRSSLPTIPGFPRVKERAEQLIGKARDAVPEGTFAVGGGLMITALTTYVFLIVANQALPNKPYAALNTFWALHLRGRSRALPAARAGGRAARSPTGAPRASAAVRWSTGPPASPALLTAAMVVLAIALSPLYVDGAFHSDAVVVAALAIGLVGFAFMHLTRGTLSGNGRFKPYGVILAIDGTAKLVAALVLWSLGVESAGAYAMCIAFSPFVATGIALIGQHGLLEDGPDGAVLGAVEVRSAGSSRARCSCRRSATPCSSASAS